MKRMLVLLAALTMTLLMTFGGVASASSHLDEEEDVLGERVEHVEEDEDAAVALAETGFELSTGALLGGAFLVGGGGLLLAARRRGAKQ